MKDYIKVCVNVGKYSCKIITFMEKAQKIYTKLVKRKYTIVFFSFLSVLL